jgi:hypothetical protein
MPTGDTFGPDEVSGRFHSLGPAPHASRPSITVEHNQGPLVDLRLDFGVGRSGQERAVLEIAQQGTFRFPERIDQGELLYIRCRHLPSEVRISVQWDKEE